MFNDPVSFNGSTRVEVIAVLANCGRDTDKARRALVTWIRRKQDKGRTTEHILAKLRDIESKARSSFSPGPHSQLTSSKFIRDTTLHSAFRDARAETSLPRAPDLPLPAFLRKSIGQTSESVPSVINSTERVSISSTLVELTANLAHRTSPPISPLRLSPDSSEISDTFPGKSFTSQRMSLAQDVPHLLPSFSPRIQIPCDRSLQQTPNSPVTSSPEELELHLRYRSMSHPVGSSSARCNGLVTPISASPPESLLNSLPHQNLVPYEYSSRGLVSTPPSRIHIPRSRSQRSFPHSPQASSSDESDVHPRRYRPISQPIASTPPGFRRVTPARTFPPDVPLPPIPSDDQGVVDSDGDYLRKSLPAEPPHTPLRSPASFYSLTPVRPLPIQPIPSPVPGSDELEAADAFGEDSLRQDWRGSMGELPADIVVRQDSPVYMFHDDHTSSTGICPPSPCSGQCVAISISPADMPTIGESLGRVVDECGGSHDVRLVVCKCIEFHRGYEPPYWQTRLQACGLHAEAARHLVDEMCKQVDWGSSFRRSS